MRYSTSEMAKDILEVLDHLGWTSERQLHILGVSMGGMIALEIVRHPLPQPLPNSSRPN
jgi:pimeloyl-ACP methyl ester carboxylesterase